MPESEAKKRWVLENTTRIGMKLNNNTDQDIIEHLKKQDSIQGYIKALIRKDIGSGPVKSAKPSKLGPDMTIHEARDAEKASNAMLDVVSGEIKKDSAKRGG